MNRRRLFAVAVAASVSICLAAGTANGEPSVSGSVPTLAASGTAILQKSGGAFVHPGVLYSAEDLARAKSLLNREPWKTAFAALAAGKTATVDYRMRGPFEEVGREPDIHRDAYESDMAAVQDQALMWYFTGKQSYANNAIKILNAWSSTHRKWSGKTPGLESGDQGCAAAAGAEILRYTHSGWRPEDIQRCEEYFKDMIFREDISVGRAEDPIGESNQGASHLKSMIAVAVFRNDLEEFNYTVRVVQLGTCTSIRRNFLPSGQEAEEGRDQPHPLGAIANYVATCQTAWIQGLDLFGLEDNRLLTAMEYWSKYNLGEEVPYQPFGDCHDLWRSISPKGRGPGRAWAPVELVYAHYVLSKRLSAPYTLRYREGLPPTVSTLLYRVE